ncbi:NAD-dependent epimerase/dehydratase family protein [Wukongibacter baidiensis]|uniref:NAD-dependent epimerase/dehydratase family protein n=1 Tax=Wukongibacter baidiensis TaxID=1723361 RepID=UPI003D7F3CB1
MKVLITGGCGFIGSHTAERFYKEGYKVYIIDNLSSGRKENLIIKHKLYEMDVEDRKCEEIFANNDFDIVIHLAAHIDAALSIEKPCLDAESNVLGLINILELSSKYNVKKFIFASSAAVYGDNEKIPLIEDDGCNPITPYGVSKLTGEKYCGLWKTIHNLDTTCLRFSNVYGPRQSIKGEGGVVSIFMNNVFNNRKLLVYGDGQQTRDFIYVEDLVDAIYKAVEFCSSDILNISTNTQVSINDLIHSIKKLHRDVEIEYTKPREGDILHSRLLNDEAIKELSWAPIYSLEKGIEKTYRWYSNYCKQNDAKVIKESKVKEKKEKKSFLRSLLPYFENLISFFIAYFLSRFSQKIGMETVFDFKLIYIIVIAILYGLKQASIAVFLSCTLFIWDIRETGHDIISLIYNINTLIYFSVYIFVGAVLGYSVDSKKFEIDSKEEALKEIKEKFDFLYDMYNESKLVRKELQDQILSSEDSFGKIYKITSTLDTLEPEKVFGQTVGVIEEIMKSKDICIFSVSKAQNYLRLISKSKESYIQVNKSIKVKDFPEIENLINTKSTFVNKDLKKSLPMMMSPIVVNEKVIAIIAIYKMEFETMSLYKQNLLKAVSSLVTSTLARAYQYDEAIYDEKYVSGTLVLKRKYFSQLLQNKIEIRQKDYADFILLRVSGSNWQDGDISYQIGKTIRELDYIGVNEKNELFVLLANTSKKEAQFVISRFNKINIDVELIEEDEYYGNLHIGTFSA